MNIKAIFNNDDDRAVSPVIGVILMVAITVILAAVIGTFVLGLGDSLGDQTPQASFNTDVNAFYSDDVTDGPDAGLHFEMEKIGGQDLTTGDLRVTVDGTETARTVASALDEDDEPESWRTGDVATWEGEPEDFTVGNDFGANDRITIRMSHTPSGGTVYTTTVSVPQDSSE